jgi:hypothetical protein
MYESNVNTADLVVISEVQVDLDLPKHEKIIDYVRQIKDPYHYIAGKFNITAVFLPNGATFEECLQDMMM